MRKQRLIIDLFLWASWWTSYYPHQISCLHSFNTINWAQPCDPNWQKWFRGHLIFPWFLLFKTRSRETRWDHWDFWATNYEITYLCGLSLWPFVMTLIENSYKMHATVTLFFFHVNIKNWYTKRKLVRKENRNKECYCFSQSTYT